jgi:hypothetical protein
MHISLDLVRRETGLAPSEIVSILRGMSSLGVQSELREKDEDHEESDIVTVRWYDMHVANSQFRDGMFGHGNATELLKRWLT